MIRIGEAGCWASAWKTTDRGSGKRKRSNPRTHPRTGKRVVVFRVLLHYQSRPVTPYFELFSQHFTGKWCPNSLAVLLRANTKRNGNWWLLSWSVLLEEVIRCYNLSIRPLRWTYQLADIVVSFFWEPPSKIFENYNMEPQFSIREADCWVSYASNRYFILTFT